jgi:FkbM family methyltransferase
MGIIAAPEKVIKRFVQSSLQGFDIGLTRYSKLQKLQKNPTAADEIEFLLALPNQHSSQILQYLRKSKAEFRQDLFALSELEFKRDGYFVEFGATNGVDYSNTHLLQNEFGWNGILAEPAQCWHNELRGNRDVHIETKCVWRDSNSVLEFNEVSSGGLSGINAFSSLDFNREARKSGRTYKVETISLNDLLAKYDAPKQIDFLSIDTEGSEFEILSHFDFSRHQFRAIACEHNFTPMRQKILSLLTEKGYERKFPELSKVDDWYVRRG